MPHFVRDFVERRMPIRLLGIEPGLFIVWIGGMNSGGRDHPDGHAFLPPGVHVSTVLGSRLGIAVNWGRSALETRSTQGPLDHIARARDAGLLRGLMFSGASGAESPYGVWKDTHMPPAQAFGISHYAAESLLTGDEIEKCLQASDYRDLDFLGVKIGVRPATLTAEERAAFNRDALAILDKLTG